MVPSANEIFFQAKLPFSRTKYTKLKEDLFEKTYYIDSMYDQLLKIYGTASSSTLLAV